MKIAFYGSSLLSSYWNGAATYYRGILRALHGHGYDVTFYEPDAFDRQQHRDIDPPPYAKVVVYPATAEGLASVLAEAPRASRRTRPRMSAWRTASVIVKTGRTLFAESVPTTVALTAANRLILAGRRNAVC